MKIDAFTHILPPNYFNALKNKSKSHPSLDREGTNLANTNLETRLLVMDRYPEVMQVVSISQPPLESIVSPTEAIELARMANDELAEIISKYPNRFLAGVACLPMSDIEAALKEAERALNKLQFRGVQIYSEINGEALGSVKFRPLYDMMAQCDLPIWIHPSLDMVNDEPIFGWPYKTSSAMLSLVANGVLRDYPDIKFIVHHAGAMAPFFEQRIRWLYPLRYGFKDVKNPLTDFQKFYCDTAVYGSTSALMCAYDFFGPDHILFGTDAPLGPNYGLTAQTIDSVQAMDIPDYHKEKIFSQNVISLLRTAI